MAEGRESGKLNCALFSPAETKRTFSHYCLTGVVSYMAMLKSLLIVVAVT